MRPTAFLDRDGTLNREVDFVRSPDELVVLPGARDALERLRDAGWRIVVVTNQSGVARGYFDERTLAAIHAKLHRELGALPDAYLHCPHHPDGGFGYARACACRKPGAGLLHEATELLGADLSCGAVVGDSARDVLMARDTRLSTVLVRSGKPIAEQQAKLAAAGATPDFVADALPDAVDWLLAR